MGRDDGLDPGAVEKLERVVQCGENGGVVSAYRIWLEVWDGLSGCATFDAPAI